MDVLPDLVTPADGVRLRGLRRVEYERLIETGVLEGEHVELLGGELVELSPQGHPHAWAISELNRQLAPLMDRGYDVRVQLPLATDDMSLPEPDLAVVDLQPKHATEHPTTAHLAVEVAVTTLRMALVHKAPRYAAAGVTTYVVLDVPGHRAVVHTDPTPDGYATTTDLGPGDDLEVLGIALDLQRLLGD